MSTKTTKTTKTEKTTEAKKVKQSIKTLAEAEAAAKAAAASTPKKSPKVKAPAPVTPAKVKKAKVEDTPAPKVKKGKTPVKKSITQVIYGLLSEMGPENVTVEMAEKAALEVNPDSKFNKWHLYFHRKNFRSLVTAGEDPMAKWNK